VAILDNPTREIEAIVHAWPGFTHTQSKRIRHANNWICAEYGQLRLMYHRISGGVDAKVRQIGPGTGKGYVRFPINDDLAIRIARTFLGSGWFIEDDSEKLIFGKVTHLQRQHASSQGIEPVESLDAGVILTRVIDETPVVGPGGQVMVNILPDGTISGASRVFRPRGTKVDMASIMSPEEALTKFEQRLRRDRRLNSPVRVVNARFGYFEAGCSLRQRFFEPAYNFMYVAQGPETFTSVEVIQASGSNRGQLSGVSTS
jgi:hypothetical protein